MSKETEDFIAHFGVKGMKWGVSKTTPTGTPRKTEREAKKDATEFAKAKMYYGEGAGIRRRHINNTVKSKSKDPSYKEAFDRNLEGQNMAKRAAQSRGERKRKDISNSTRKTARGIKHVLTGQSKYANIAAIGIVAGGKYANSKGYDKQAYSAAKKHAAAGAKFVSNYMKR